MASIERRPNDTLRVCWRYEGKQQRVTVDNRRDADMLVRWLDKNGPRSADDVDLLWVLGRTPKVDAPPSTKTVLEELTRVIDGARTEGTRKTYRTAANRLLRADPTLGDLPVTTVTRALVVDLWDGPDGLVAKYGESSWRLSAIVLQLALDPHGMRDLLKGYAGRATDRERDPVVMTKAAMDLLVALGHDHGIGNLLALYTDLGVRFGEGAALLGGHVEDQGGEPWVRVREQFSAVSHGRGVARTATPLKSTKSRRDLPASPRVVALAEQARAGLLAPGPDGGPWEHSRANRLLAKVSADAIAEGIVSRPVHFHDFRHSWGAHLLRGGLDLVSVSRLLGHSSTAVTDKAYGHLTAQGVDLARSLLK